MSRSSSLLRVKTDVGQLAPPLPDFFAVNRKLCSGLEKAWGLLALFVLIFARFEFDLAIYCSFRLF